MKAGARNSILDFVGISVFWFPGKMKWKRPYGWCVWLLWVNVGHKRRAAPPPPLLDPPLLESTFQNMYGSCAWILCVNVWTYIYIHTYIYTYTHMCICICTCECIQNLVRECRAFSREATLCPPDASLISTFFFLLSTPIRPITLYPLQHSRQLWGGFGS